MGSEWLNILVSTCGEGIGKIPDMLLPQRAGVRYIVSWQHDAGMVMPPAWAGRDDVKLFMMQGRGLSRNRNNTLKRADCGICLIADDDCRYTPDYLDNITRSYSEHPDADIILFMAQGLDKSYPDKAMKLSQAIIRGETEVISMKGE